MTTTRRTAMSALLGIGGGTALLCSGLNRTAWRAFEAVEEAWIRDRHALVVDQCPECPEAAAIDLELKLAELQRRGMQFQFLLKHNPQQLRGGMWQLSWLPMTDTELARMTVSTAYRKQDEKVRRLTEDLRQSSQYDGFRKAQTRLWKTPDYHSLHRRYSGRLQELNRIYSDPAASSF